MKDDKTGSVVIKARSNKLVIIEDVGVKRDTSQSGNKS